MSEPEPGPPTVGRAVLAEVRAAVLGSAVSRRQASGRAGGCPSTLDLNARTHHAMAMISADPTTQHTSGLRCDRDPCARGQVDGDPGRAVGPGLHGLLDGAGQVVDRARAQLGQSQGVA